jgi:hypothetical protein
MRSITHQPACAVHPVWFATRGPLDWRPLCSKALAMPLHAVTSGEQKEKA